MNKIEEERRRKISLSLIGNKRTLGHKLSEEHKRKISPKGRKLSEETKRKIGDAHRGLKFTKEHREKLSKAHLGVKLSKETRSKMSVAHKGENASNWRGGITPLSKRIRGSIEIRLWRESVFARDNWTCQGCGGASGNGKKIFLESHHIKSFSQYPELRFVIDNGLTLCKECHKKTDNYAHKANTNWTNLFPTLKCSPSNR
jgi:5-methylcytosine-specific restriction endonuclease McrA